MASPTSCGSAPTTATATPKPRPPRPSCPAAEGDKAPFTVKAIEGGSAGDNITVEVADASEPSDDNFKLIVKSPGKPDEVFDNVTTGRGANNVVTRVKAESQLITIQEVRGATAKPARTTTSLSGGAVPADDRERRRRPTTSATPPTAPASPASRRSRT